MDNLHSDTIRVTDVTERFFNFCKFCSLLPRRWGGTAFGADTGGVRNMRIVPADDN